MARRAAALLALVALAGLVACAPIDDPDVVSSGAPVEAAAEVIVDNPIAQLPDPRKVAGDLALPPPSTSSTTSTTVDFELPVPEPLPFDAYEPTPEVVVGRIAIPEIGVDEELHEGMTLTAINRGPSMWPGTALPGQVGNLVVAGHRTTYGGPFRQLDQLEPGDTATFTTDEGTSTYEVEGTQIVQPEAVDIANQSNHFTATLFACHPPGSAAQRIVVTLVLLGPDGEPVPPAT